MRKNISILQKFKGPLPYPFLCQILMAFIIVGITPAFAQTDDIKPTNELWTGFTLKHKLSQKNTFNFDQQTRFTDNVTKVRTVFLELGIRHKINKYFDIKGQYRYTFRNSKHNAHRISFDARAKWKFKPVKLELIYRFRLQNTLINYTGQNIPFLRNRITLKYPFTKKLNSYAEYESFYRFDTKSKFVANRYTLGLKYDLNKMFGVNLFYQIDQEINVRYLDKRNVVAILLKITI